MSASFAPSGSWISLMDYATRKGVSLSTLRRYIKANKIQHRIENGRYLLWDESGAESESSAAAPSASISESDRIQELETKLRRAQAEIAELKMLVSVYEDQHSNPPSLHP